MNSEKAALAYKVLNKHTPINMGIFVIHIGTSKANYVRHYFAVYSWDKSNNMNEISKECPETLKDK